MKLIKRLVIFGIIGLVLLFVVGGIVLTLSINSIAKKGIEVGGTSALGVETKLSKASIGLFSGKFGLTGLDVSNPTGYPSPLFVHLGDAKVAVSLGSLTKDTIEVPEFTMDGLDVRLERRNGKSNYDVILANLEKFTGGSGTSTPKPTETKKEGQGKKLIVKELTLKNITIHADMVDGTTPGLADIAKVTVPIPEIKLQNVGQTGSGVGGSGVTIGELSSIIVQTIMAAAVEKGGVLPDQLLGELKTRLSGLGGLKGLDLKMLGEGGSVKAIGEQFGAKVTDLGSGAKKAVEDATKGLGPAGEKAAQEATKQIDKATEKLKGLLPKKDAPKPAEPKPAEPPPAQPPPAAPK